MIHIVTATTDDFPSIQSIAHRTWPETFGAILSSGQIEYMLEWMYSIDSLKEQVEVKRHVFIIARDKFGDHGFAAYELFYNNLPRTKIHKIYILPSSQGKGIGRMLLNAIEEIAISHGNKTLFLNVNRNNPAVGIYKKLGYKIVKEEDIDIGNGFFMNDYVMKKGIICFK